MAPIAKPHRKWLTVIPTMTADCFSSFLLLRRTTIMKKLVSIAAMPDMANATYTGSTDGWDNELMFEDIVELLDELNIMVVPS